MADYLRVSMVLHPHKVTAKPAVAVAAIIKVAELVWWKNAIAA